MRAPAFFMLALSVSACGAKATSDTAPDGSTPGLYASDCPQRLPEIGTSCTPPSGTCEYGDDPHCTTVVGCGTTGADNAPFLWVADPPDPSCAGNAAACPATFDALAGGSACPVATDCSYAEGRCGCAPCTLGAATGGEWTCEAWPAPSGCPVKRPRLGTVCSASMEGVMCAYGAACCAAVSTGPYEGCVNGSWREEGGGCSCLGPPQCPSESNLHDGGAGDAGGAK